MLTLEEAIKAEETEAMAYEECLNSLDENMPTDMRNEFNKSLGKQMDYHRQLAEWLRELKEYKDARVGCEYCKHKFREQHERPCSLCQRNFMDMFESEVNADDRVSN